MICSHIATLLGMQCSPLDEAGTLAMLHTPFAFADGDPVPLFVEVSGQTVRFFDDGLTALHFSGRGMRLQDARAGKFLSKAAIDNGAAYTSDWILEALAPTPQQAPRAFASYVAAMLSICAWERDNEGATTDMVLLVNEVAMAYRALRPQADIEPSPSFTGISGKVVQLDLLVDGVGIAVTSTHHAAVNAALHKVVDISQSTQNAGLKLRFVIDDRIDATKARSEANILQAAAEVQLLSNLERTAPMAH